MGSTFLPRLINGPFDDPALFVPFRYDSRALLFDLGEIHALPSREILKVTHIFVTHTHMDHFAGFDHILRIFLGRDKDLYLYGPQGFIDNVKGKLAGYCWNLVGNYKNRFALHVTELHPSHSLSCSFSCKKGFQAPTKASRAPFDGIVLKEQALTVHAAHLDHGTPVLGFALREPFHVNIDKMALERMGVCPGPWLNRLKVLLHRDADPSMMIEIPQLEESGEPVRYSVEALKKAIVLVSPGQALAYITDVAGTQQNVKKIVALAKGVDHLYVEAAFSENHRDIAMEKNHLTARTAGEVARLCGARHFSVFHFSPRYKHCPGILEKEATAAFRGAGKS